MGWQDVRPSDEVQAADWIRGRLLPFDKARIGSVIPIGFAAYVRADLRQSPFSAIGPQVAELLARHTTSPDRCWFCLWEGYGYLTGASWETRSYRIDAGKPVPPGPSVKQVPRPDLGDSRVRLPGRAYLLFTGEVERGAGWMDGPNLWWPSDHAWIVACEIDLDYALIGGTRKLCDELIKSVGATSVEVEDHN